MSAPLRWTITVRYSGGTNVARNRDTGLSCSSTESEFSAVLGLAKKIRPKAVTYSIREISPGVWVLTEGRAA